MTEVTWKILKRPPDYGKNVERLFEEAFNRGVGDFNRKAGFGWKAIEEIYDGEEVSSGWIDGKVVLQSDADAAGEGRQGDEKVRLRETARAYILEVIVPDLKAESIFIEVVGQMLVINGEKAGGDPEMAAPGEERSAAVRFRWVLHLPPQVRPRTMTAQYRNGRVRVEIPK